MEDPSQLDLAGPLTSEKIERIIAWLKKERTQLRSAFAQELLGQSLPPLMGVRHILQEEKDPPA